MNDGKITLTLTLPQLQMLDTVLSNKVTELHAANRPWRLRLLREEGRLFDVRSNIRNMEHLHELVAAAVIPAEER